MCTALSAQRFHALVQQQQQQQQAYGDAISVHITFNRKDVANDGRLAFLGETLKSDSPLTTFAYCLYY